MRKLICLCILCTTLFTRCTPPLYIPNYMNTPSLSEQEEIEVNTSIGTNGANLNLAYALTDEWGAGASIDYLRYGNFSFEDPEDSEHHDYYEGFVLRTFRPKNPTSRIRLSLLGSTGFGITKGSKPEVNFYGFWGYNSVSGSYTRTSIQPNLGWVWEGLEIHLSIRNSLVNVLDIETSIGHDPLGVYEDTDAMSGRYPSRQRSNYNYFVEPGATFKYGFRRIKSFLQVGASLNMLENSSTNFDHRKILSSVGVQIDLSTARKTSRSKG